MVKQNYVAHARNKAGSKDIEINPKKQRSQRKQLHHQTSKSRMIKG